jgi:hypothetical protein
VHGRKEALTEDERYALPSAQFPACAAASAPIRSDPHSPRSFQLFQARRLCVKSTGICSSVRTASTRRSCLLAFGAQRDSILQRNRILLRVLRPRRVTLVQILRPFRLRKSNGQRNYEQRHTDPLLRTFLQALRQIRAGDADHFRYGLHREPSFGGDGGSRSCFFGPVACSSASLRISASRVFLPSSRHVSSRDVLPYSAAFQHAGR